MFRGLFSLEIIQKYYQKGCDLDADFLRVISWNIVSRCKMAKNDSFELEFHQQQGKKKHQSQISLFLPNCDSLGFKFFSKTLVTYSQRYDDLLTTVIFFPRRRVYAFN